MNPLIQLKKTTPLFRVAFVLGCFALSPTAQAVSPTPDGGYPNENTAEGTDTLFSLTSGGDDTAVGFNALYNNTGGFNNTALGAKALSTNTIGSSNTATGHDTLTRNTTGSSNTADGDLVLLANTTGSENTGTGSGVLWNNTTGYDNTATGVFALVNNITGHENTANGVFVLYTNDSGSGNTANGAEALFYNNTGRFNTASGCKALEHNTTGNSNIALGYQAGADLTRGSNNIDIGNPGVSGESNVIRIGTVKTNTSTFIAGIYKTTLPKGLAVVVDSTGHLGTTGSADRFKDAIKPMDKASEAIHALKPVTFHYKQEFDPEGTLQFGLVAEDVEKVDPDLVVRDDRGELYSVRYDAVNAMLLNEFLKEHRRVQEQQAAIAELKSTVANQQQKSLQQQKQIEVLAAGLQKVSARLAAASPSDGGLELSKAPSQTVLKAR